MTEYKRLLIIHGSKLFGESGSSDQTIRSFLGDYPKDKIFVISCGDFNVKKRGRINSHIYQLSIEDIRFVRYILRSIRQSAAMPHPIMLEKQTNKVTLRQKFRYLLASCYGWLKYRINDDLHNFIKDAAPEIIYSQVIGRRAVALTRTVAKRYRLPLLFHYLDDWPNTSYTDMVVAKLFKWRLQKELSLLSRESGTVMCISDVMCREYDKIYGTHNFVTMLNSVTDSKYIIPPPKKDIKSFVYAGSLYLSRDKTLQMICDELAKISVIDIRLDIFSIESQWETVKEIFSKYPFVHYGGCVSHDDIMKKLHKYDVLLFVESFNTDILRYSRYSISTRVPEYLSTGRTILAVGPQGQGSIDYMEENKAAYVAHSRKEVEICIKRIEGDPIENAQIVTNARELFLKNHLSSVQQRRFLDIISNAVKS